MTTKVTMPQLGESVVEGTIGKWLVEAGQVVQKDQPLVEVLTDKADSEIPAPVSGRIQQILAQVDDTVSVGQTLCEIEEGATGDAGASGESKTSSQASAAPRDQGSATQNDAASGGSNDAGPGSAGQASPAVASSGQAKASPAVRKYAREHGISLDQIEGHQAAGGRIGMADLSQPKQRAAVAAPAQRPASEAASSGRKSAFRVPPYMPQPGDEVVPYSRRRRIIADHMVYSKTVAPDVVTFAECDLHETTKLRESKKGALKKEGVNLTFLAFVCAAVARSLREHPEINARVLDDAYVKLKDINLGIAVDTPDGLVVPVIRRADELTVRGLAKAIDELALRARDGALTPDDLAGKTFTISNPGRKGNLVGGAIISQPNVGILRLGTMKKRVVVVERDGEDLLAIHPMMQMALTYDHRIVDGVHANSFLFRIAELLERGEFEV